MALAHLDVVTTWTEPDPVPLRGTVVLIPGRGESAQVYERVHGRDDPLSPIEADRAWYTAELVSVAGARHDVLNDQTHPTAAASVVLFLERLRAGADLAPIALTEQFRDR